MDLELLEFDIESLNGKKNFHLEFEDNILILVGENGSQKTTICKLLHGLMTKNWPVLFLYDFSSIRLSFCCDGKRDEIQLDQEKFLKEVANTNIDRRWYEAFFSKGISRRERERSLRYVFDSLGLCGGKRARAVSERHGIPLRNRRVSGMTVQSDEIISSINRLWEIDEKLEEVFSHRVLYLPTYRRIEDDLDSLIEPNEELTRVEAKRIGRFRYAYSEMIQFGMEDVEDALEKREGKLRWFSQQAQQELTLRYLSKILAREYKNPAVSSSCYEASMIDDVLSRIDSGILGSREKKQIADSISKVQSGESAEELDLILFHYFSQLKEFCDTLKNEESCFIDFSRICNSYLYENRINYDSHTLSCDIEGPVTKHDGDGGIDRGAALSRLSSGEKQIVSIFSKLNLEYDKSMFVIIDEPELSLSIEWQRKLLPDMLSSSGCCGLMATTHSPFIFENGLVAYVHGVNEFEV